MTLEIVPGSLTNPDPSIKNYAPYAPAIGVTGYIDRWRPALDFAAAAVGDTVLSYPSPLNPTNVLVGDTVAPPVVIDDSGIRMINCATLGATSALTDTNRKFNSDATFLVVWKESAAGSVSHGILMGTGLQFRRGSASWSVSKLSGVAGSTLTIGNDASAGGVAIAAKRYAAIIRIPYDGTSEVSVTMIGAGQSSVTVNAVVSRGGTAAEQRTLSIGKKSGDNASNGPLYAELVVWDRALTDDEVSVVSAYVTEQYSL